MNKNFTVCISWTGFAIRLDEIYKNEGGEKEKKDYEKGISDIFEAILFANFILIESVSNITGVANFFCFSFIIFPHIFI